MNINKCDLCKQEINTNEKIFSLWYHEKNSLAFLNKKNSGELCIICMEKIKTFINTIKK
jgi:hypothetical protein